MADENGEKTEDPSDRRRQEQREKGNVARSQDLAAAALMLAASVTIALFTIPLCETLGGLIGGTMSSAKLEISRVSFKNQAWDYAGVLFRSVLPILIFTAATAIAVNLAQVGFLFSPSVLQPKPERLNPIQGAQRILSVRALMKLCVSLGKLALLTVVAGLITWWELPDMAVLPTASVAQSFGVTHALVVRLAFALAAALLALALLDFMFQKWKYEQDIKMTKQEVRDEMKNMEGDPMIRQRRKEAHRKLAEARNISAAKDADVVVTNPTHYAVALKYDPESMAAPTVLAKGVDEIALRIRRVAADNDVPIIERPELARSLYRDVKVGRPVPEDLYGALVEVLAYVYRLSGRRPPNLF
ncbi:flagellar biosynthesis protein FlhB [Stratiformator vulcanicus]|uniref:Flagellar biosynthetic protein FlhB n=1 Tax=Stratiformator vulcanicus TaxID=2527980 RepID=A0A517R5D9_9PLAN|nr:flagellar biosynthesis protein FlhB [Stratiformator vulcanicus]QDT39043.1 Flagellar biosynthetic protein FlhB [Stratiformator vulcanicus]